MKALPVLKIKGRSFGFVKKRRDAELLIYKHKNLFLRIGSHTEIKKEISVNSRLSSFKFPIPKIVEKSTLNGKSYCIEESLGEYHFSEIFAKDIKKSGAISKKSFSDFISITKKYAEAQLKTVIKSKDLNQFTSGIHLRYVLAERPDLKGKILKLYNEVKNKLSVYPLVLTHGDFNSHNLYKKGVIDLEEIFYAPAGYDIVTNIFHIEYFPKSKNFELYQFYNFSKIQKKKYLEVFDKLYLKHGLPTLTENLKYFEFSRAVWMLARMGKWPKIQKWRYDKFIKRYL